MCSPKSQTDSQKSWKLVQTGVCLCVCVGGGGGGGGGGGVRLMCVCVGGGGRRSFVNLK